MISLCASWVKVKLQYISLVIMESINTFANMTCINLSSSIVDSTATQQMTCTDDRLENIINV